MKSLNKKKKPLQIIFSRANLNSRAMVKLIEYVRKRFLLNLIYFHIEMVSFKIKKQNLIEKVIELLKSIYDPEISVNIYELGLIYDIQINKLAHLKVIMTLTTPNCPVADNFVKEIKQKIQQKIQPIDKVKTIDVILTFDPIWRIDMLSEEASFQLELE